MEGTGRSGAPMAFAGGSDFTLQIFKSSLCDTQEVKKVLAQNVRENQQIPFAEGDRDEPIKLESLFRNAALE